MIMRLFYGLMFILLSNYSIAQSQFQKRYGSLYHDHSTKVIQTVDGNFLTVGTTDGFGSGGNAFIMKADLNGNILWTKDYSGINGEVIFDIKEIASGNLIMCGLTGSYGAGSTDAFVMKTDSIGNLIWARAYGDIFFETFNNIAEDGVDGLYVSGTADQTTSGGQRGSIILRMDSTGYITWMKFIPQSMGNNDPLMAKLATGGVIIGHRESPNISFSLWKFSASGNLIWSNNYLRSPSGSGLHPLSIVENQSGEIIVTTSLSNINTFAQSVDVVVIKMDSSGNVNLNKSYGGIYVDIASDVKVSHDNGIIICGYTNSAGNGFQDDFIMKLDYNGSFQWAKAYGTVWNENPYSCIQTADSGFLFTGFTYSTGANYDSTKIHLVKTDSLGNSACNDISWTAISNNQSVITDTTVNPVNFSFIDENIINWTLNNRYFYEANLCIPVSIEYVEHTSADFKIFPNPFNLETTLESNSGMSGTLELFNMYGKLTKHISISKSTTVIERGNLNSGVYIYKIIPTHGIITWGKLIIE